MKLPWTTRGAIHDALQRENLSLLSIQGRHSKWPLCSKAAPDPALLPLTDKPVQGRILAFTCSGNQQDVLIPALEDIGADRVRWMDMAPQPKQWQIEPINFWQVVRATSLKTLSFIVAHPGLYFNHIKRNGLYNSRDIFRATVSLFVMRKILEDTRPNLICVSNDHLVQCRALLIMARWAGIPTLYVQHASVSQVFPRLSFDYACLDGEHAEEVYQQCHANHAAETILNQTPKIFLTGNQRIVINQGSDKRVGRIGICLNMTDDEVAMRNMAEDIEAEGYTPVIRWHPRYDSHKVNSLKSWLAERDFEYCDPAIIPSAGFLTKLEACIGGDSGILLEAGLAGSAPLYFKEPGAPLDDYYGFVASGIARRVDCSQSAIEAVSSNWRPNYHALRQHSATYGTTEVNKSRKLLSRVIDTASYN